MSTQNNIKYHLKIYQNNSALYDNIVKLINQISLTTYILIFVNERRKIFLVHPTVTQKADIISL